MKAPKAGPMEGTPLLRLFLPRPGFTRHLMQRSHKLSFPGVLPQSKIIFRAKGSHSETGSTTGLFKALPADRSQEFLCRSPTQLDH